MSSQPTKSKQNSKKGFGMKSLDVLGSKFNLSFTTPTGKFQTKLGGYLTVMMVVIATSCFALIMSQYFNRDSPEVNTSTEFLSKKNSFNMYQENLITPFAVFLGGRYLKEDQFRYITIKTKVFDMKYNDSIVGFNIKPKFQFDYKPCSEISDQRLIDFIKSVNPLPGLRTAILCPDLRDLANEFKVSDNSQDYEYTRVSTSVYPCSLDVPTQCAPDYLVSKAKLSFLNIFKYYKSSDFDDPMRSSPNRGSLRFDLHATKYWEYGIKLNRVVDHTIQMKEPSIRADYATLELFSTDFTTRSSSQTHCAKSEIAKGSFGSCKEYFVFDYFAREDMTQIRRNYKEVTTMLGEFGGILKLITSALFFFSSIYYNRKMKDYLSFKVFKFDKSACNFLKNFNRKKSVRISFNHAKSGKTNIFGGAPSNRVETEVEREGGVKNMIKSSVMERVSVESLMAQLNIVEIFEDAIFEDYHRALFPIALLVKKNKKVLNSSQREGEVQGWGNKVSPIDLNHPEGGSNQNQKGIAMSAGKGDSKGSQMNFEKALTKLKTTTPKNDLQKIINQYLIETLTTDESGMDEAENLNDDEELDTPNGSPGSKIMMKMHPSSDLKRQKNQKKRRFNSLKKHIRRDRRGSLGKLRERSRSKPRSKREGGSARSEQKPVIDKAAYESDFSEIDSAVNELSRDYEEASYNPEAQNMAKSRFAPKK